MQLPLDLYSSFSLPEAVAVEILTSIEACSNSIKPKLSILINESERLRQTILEREPDLIQSVNQQATPISLGAVDGTQTIQPSTGADFVAVVAFRFDALQQIHHLAMIDTVSHSVNIDNILAGMRNILEAELLGDALPDYPLILDGSYWSILQDINRMFYTYDKTYQDIGLWKVFSYRLGHFIEEHIFPRMLESRGVLANSKRAVSDTYVSRFLPELNNSIADRALFTVILQPDEYTKPNLLANGTTGRVGIATYRSEDVPLMWSNEDRNFIETFYSEEIYVVYYRPFEWGPAYRLEMPTLLTKKIDQILAGFKKALISPDIIEPYPQFLVDKLCKQMPIALQAVMEGTTNALRQEFEPDLLRKFFGAYRTR